MESSTAITLPGRFLRLRRFEIKVVFANDLGEGFKELTFGPPGGLRTFFDASQVPAVNKTTADDFAKTNQALADGRTPPHVTSQQGQHDAGGLDNAETSATGAAQM